MGDCCNCSSQNAAGYNLIYFILGSTLWIFLSGYLNNSTRPSPSDGDKKEKAKDDKKEELRKRAREKWRRERERKALEREVEEKMERAKEEKHTSWVWGG